VQSQEWTLKRIGLFILSAIFAAQPVLTGSNLNSAEKRTLELTPAVVLVVVTFSFTAEYTINQQAMKKQWSYRETGTGFLYRPDGYLITNGHVVQHANTKDANAQSDLNNLIVKAVLTGLIKDYPALGQFHSVDEIRQAINLQISKSDVDLRVWLANKKDYHGEIKAFSDPIDQGGKDVAILKIDANNLPTLKLGDSNNVRIQEGITVIGYPGIASPLNFNLLGQESVFVPTVTFGHVSALKVDYKGTPVIQADAAITHGNSGGPAFNDAGEAIAIATFGNEGEVAGFNFFVPINTAVEFVHQVGVTPETGLFNHLWTEALDTYDVGKCETSKSKLQNVLNIMPNEPDAVRMMASASACADKEGAVGRFMETGGWLLYSAVGVVILATLALMFLRRKPAVAGGGASVTPAISGGPGGAKRVEVGGPAGIPPSTALDSYGSIQITSGSLSGRRFKVTKSGLLMGRDASKCQVVFNEDTVSSEHAWIVPVDNNVVVIDRGSSNGTYINSVESPRVSKVGLQNGDRVYLGKQGAVVFTYFK
jgi:serine protease Do